MLDGCLKDGPAAADNVAIIQEFAGACLLGLATSRQKALVLLGDGANRKGWDPDPESSRSLGAEGHAPQRPRLTVEICEHVQECVAFGRQVAPGGAARPYARRSRGQRLIG